MSKRMSGRYAFIAAIGVVLTAFTHVAPVQAQAQRSPITASRFGISVDGVQIGVFAQLTSEADLATGARGAITLAGGRTQGIEMAAWHELVILGDVAAARKSATIVIYDSSGSPVKRYHLENAWPAKVLFESSERGLRTATVMLVYETLRVQVD